MVPTGGGVANDTVTAQDVALAWSSDAATVTQDHAVTAQDAAFALASDAATIAQDHVVTAQDAAFALTSEAATIAQDHALGAQDAAFALASEAATLAAAGNDSVTAQDASLAWASESVSIAQDHVVIGQDTELAWTSDAVSIAQDHIVTAQDAAMAFGCGTITLTSGGGGATAAEIWEYELLPGISAGSMLIALFQNTPTAAGIVTAMEADGRMLEELHRLQGLQSARPMTVTPTTRVTGDINLVLSGDGVTSTTVART